MSDSPVSTGFATVRRRPGMLAAELVWRWTFALTSLALIIASGMAFLNTIHVSRAAEAGLRSQNPFVVALTITQLFQGTGPRLAQAAAVLIPGIAAVWIVAASVGRLVTLREMLMGRGFLAPLISLALINVLRVALTLAALLFYVAAAILAGRVSQPESAYGEPNVAVFYLVFLPQLLIIVALWGVLSWFLNLAPLFIASRGRDALGSIADAVTCFRRRQSEFIGASSVYGSFKFVALLILTFFFLAVVFMLPTSNWRLMLVAAVVFSALYSVVANVLFVARLAAYAAILVEVGVSNAGIESSTSTASAIL